MADGAAPSVDGAMPPMSIDAAMDMATAFVDGVGAAYVHPNLDVFVVLGRRMFATIEPAGLAPPVYEIRLSRYVRGTGAVVAMGKRLAAQGYVELGHV